MKIKKKRRRFLKKLNQVWVTLETMGVFDVYQKQSALKLRLQDDSERQIVFPELLFYGWLF